jgi:hypothetical protein
MKKSSAEKVETPSQLIDARIKELGHWRGKTLSRLRAPIKPGRPGSRRGVEVEKAFSSRSSGVVSPRSDLHRRDVQERRETHILQGGPALKDPSGLFNSSLEGNTRRAIDFHEDDEIDEKAFATLIRAAVSLNESSSR